MKERYLKARDRLVWKGLEKLMGGSKPWTPEDFDAIEATLTEEAIILEMADQIEHDSDFMRDL